MRGVASTGTVLGSCTSAKVLTRCARVDDACIAAGNDRRLPVRRLGHVNAPVVIRREGRGHGRVGDRALVQALINATEC